MGPTKKHTHTTPKLAKTIALPSSEKRHMACGQTLATSNVHTHEMGFGYYKEQPVSWLSTSHTCENRRTQRTVFANAETIKGNERLREISVDKHASTNCRPIYADQTAPHMFLFPVTL